LYWDFSFCTKNINFPEFISVLASKLRWCISRQVLTVSTSTLAITLALPPIHSLTLPLLPPVSGTDDSTKIASLLLPLSQFSISLLVPVVCVCVHVFARLNIYLLLSFCHFFYPKSAYLPERVHPAARLPFRSRAARTQRPQLLVEVQSKEQIFPLRMPGERGWSLPTLRVATSLTVDAFTCTKIARPPASRNYVFLNISRTPSCFVWRGWREKSFLAETFFSAELFDTHSHFFLPPLSMITHA